jgi:hypothetical protein
MTLEDGSRPPIGDQSAQAAVEPRPRLPFFVDLGNGQMGIQTDRFDLAGMFSDTDDPGRADAVYFRTRSGNIYRLDARGVLVNGNESEKVGVPVVEHLDPYLLGEAEDLRQGESFRYPLQTGGIRHTTRVIEIVATFKNMALSAESALGRTSSIVVEFNQKMPEAPVSP